MTGVAPIAMLILRAFTSFLSPMIPLADVLTLDNFAALLNEPVYARAVNEFLPGQPGRRRAGDRAERHVALIVHRSNSAFRPPALRGAVPRAVPGVVAGIGFFYAFALIPGIGGIRNSIWILVIAFTMRFIPAGLGAVAPMSAAGEPDLDRAAALQGAAWWTTTRRHR